MKIELKIDNRIVELSSDSIEAIRRVASKKSYDFKKLSRYFILNSDGNITEFTFSTCRFEPEFNQGNIFFTRKEAEQERDKRGAIHRIKKFIYENDLEFEPDWNDNNERKYYIIYSHLNKTFDYDYYNELEFKNIIPILRTKEDTQKVIDNCKDDLKIIFGIK